jgi:4-amino-4-deoxy-L-arabinose transferase-like glycosyltransferase
VVRDRPSIPGGVRRLSSDPAAGIAALLAVGSILLFFRLGQQSLADWDEAIYARVSQEIIETGQWLTLQWEGRPYLRKPPLFMWSTAVLYGLFEVSEFWARAVSALSGIGVLLLTFAIGSRVYGRAAAFLGSLVLLTSYQFVASARFGTTDVMLTFHILLALYAYLRVQEGETRWWLVAWLAFGLAFMTKSAAGLLAPLAVISSVVLDRQVLLTVRSRRFWLGALVAALLVLPWHILMLGQHGSAFVDQYLGHSILERATGVVDGHSGDRLYYLDRLYRFFYPWALLAPFALVLTGRQALLGSAPVRVLLVAALLVFGLFTLAETKLRWYIVPLYPLLALFVGHLLRDAVLHWRSFAFTALALGFTGLVLTAPARLALVVLALTLAALPLAQRRRWAFRAVMAAAFVAVALTGLKDLYRGGESPVARLARIAGEDMRGSGEHLVVYHGLYRPAALFYSGRPVDVVYEPDGLDSWVPPGEPRRIILHRNALAELSDRFSFRVLAEDWALVYAVVSRLDGGDDGR